MVVELLARTGTDLIGINDRPESHSKWTDQSAADIFGTLRDATYPHKTHTHAAGIETSIDPHTGIKHRKQISNPIGSRLMM